MNKFFDKLFLVLFFCAFFCLVGAGVMITYPKYHQALGLEKERARILQQIEDKKVEIASIRERQRRFNTDREFVEMLARQNRRVYPGEIVFVFED